MIFKFLTGILFIFIFFLVPSEVFASTLYLSPGSGNVAVGAIKSVQVRLSAGGDSVNGVSAYLSYSQDKFDISYVSSSGSAFAIEAENSFGGGIIKISRGNINGLSGDVRVATIGLKGKSLGSGSLSFIGGSAAPRAADSSDSLSLGGSRGGNYNVVEASAATSSSGSSTSDNAQTPINQIPTTISDLKVLEVATDSATIAWKTDQATDSFLEYGLNKDEYIISVSDIKPILDHKLTISGPLITPGVPIHFRIKAKNPTTGAERYSEDQEIQFDGYTVTLKLIDSTGQPIRFADVTLYSDPQKAKTDEKGEVTFENVSPGKHVVVVNVAGIEKTSEINVLDDSVKQNFAVKIDLPFFGLLGFVSPLIVAGAAALFLVVLGIGLFLFIKKRKGIKSVFVNLTDENKS